MPLWRVTTTTGYCGTDEEYEIEAETADEAEAEAYELLMEGCHVSVAEEIEPGAEEEE